METSSKLLVHSFNEYLLITYCVPVTVFMYDEMYVNHDDESWFQL